jgi:hypothetical protein
MTANGPVFGVHAYNAEQRSVQITRAGLAGLNGPGVWHGHPYPPQLPARLGDGEAVFIELSEEWIHLVQASMGEDFVRGAVEDAGGTVYMSDPGPPLREPPPGNA